MTVIDQSRWKFVLTDLAGSTRTYPGLGQVLAPSSKQWSYHIDAGRTSQITINIDNPVANTVMSHDTLMKVYRKTKVSGTWQLFMVGDVIHAEEDGQDGNVSTVTIVAADPWWRLQRRLLGTAVDSLQRGVGLQLASAASPIDLGLLLQFTLGLLNDSSHGNTHTGIRSGNNTTTTSGFAGPLYLQRAGDLFQQFCTTLGGPDFELQPLEPSGSMPNTIIAQLNTGILGQSRINAVFEYGTGQRNVQSYTRILSKDGYANILYSPQQGYPQLPAAGDSFVTAADLTLAGQVGIFEDVVQADVVSSTLRQELANEYLAVRKRARQQIIVIPSVNANLDYGVDYSVGDTVTARAYANGSYRFNGTVRIYGADISVDDNDAESIALTLIPGG